MMTDDMVVSFPKDPRSKERNDSLRTLSLRKLANTPSPGNNIRKLQSDQVVEGAVAAVAQVATTAGSVQTGALADSTNTQVPTYTNPLPKTAERQGQGEAANASQSDSAEEGELKLVDGEVREARILAFMHQQRGSQSTITISPDGEVTASTAEPAPPQTGEDKDIDAIIDYDSHKIMI